jgi:ComF family protein
MYLTRRWIFSSRWLTPGRPWIAAEPWRALAGKLLSAFFPDDCRICARPLTEFSRIPVCPSCLKPPEPFEAEFACSMCRTPFLNRFPLGEEGLCALCRLGATGYDGAFTYGAYDDNLRELIHLFKYGGVEPLADVLGGLMLRAFPRQEVFDAVVPVPMHWRRRWSRGFNQAELLARVVSKNTGLKVADALRRRRYTPPQSGLTNARRRTNVSGVFAARRRAAVNGLRVLLVDDVLTTGATASACSRALKRAGAARVSILTVARADRRMFAEPRAHAAAAVVSP